MEQYASDYLTRYAEGSRGSLVLPEAGHAWHLRLDILVSPLFNLLLDSLFYFICRFCAIQAM
jgi:hypothetical protein